MRRLRQTDDYPWLKYLGAVVFGLLICIVVCLLRKIFEQTDTAQIIRILSDAFLLAGVLELGTGLLSWLRKDGTFDGLGYSFHAMRMTLFGRRTVDANGEPEAKTYYDYKQKVKAKRKIACSGRFPGGPSAAAAKSGYLAGRTRRFGQKMQKNLPFAKLFR